MKSALVRHLILLFLLWLSTDLFAFAGEPTRHSFDFGWKFSLGDHPEASQPEINDQAWRTLDVPHDFSLELPFDPNNPSGGEGGYAYGGIGWYRKHFVLEESMKDQKISVLFNGIYRNSEVWINGHYLGFRPYGYTSFQYDLTPFLNPAGQDNVMSVKVNTSQQPNSRWYTGAGIFRHVWLLATGNIHFEPWGIFVHTLHTDPRMGQIEVVVGLRNEAMQSQTGAVRIRLVDAVGKTVAATSSPVTLQGKDSLRIRRLLAVKQIHLWSVEEPYLYRLEVELLVGGKRMDASSITCGIRTYRFDPNQGFLLNGVRVQLKGTNNHHDGGPLGSACLDQTFERQLKLLKGMGCNALRMSHNPPAPELLDAADRLGFVVIDECFDEWMNGKTAAGYASYFKDWFSKDVESWIKRDRNHPSVVAWSIGNEVKEQWDPVEGPRLARLLKDEVLKFDSTRPITSGCNGIKGINASGMAQILDLVGYNYEESMYEKDHKQYPQRVILGTETLQYPYHPGPCDQFRSYDQWLAAQRNAYVAGEFIWTGFDYLGEAGIGEVGSECEFWKIWPGWPTFGATCGLLDLCGFPNTGYWFRRALWRPEPMVYLAVETDKSAIQRDKCSFWAWPKVEHHWNHPKTGDTLVVHVYTNVADVSLKLNGRSLGTKHWDPSNEAFLVWQVPYEPGALEAMGTLPNGKQVGDKVVTAGAPYRIKLVPERESIKANRQDLCYVQVYLLDRNDQPVPFADQTIQFEVSGAGKIRAVGNGNLHAYLPYQATQTKSYEGRCLVILQSGEESGLLTIKAKGENLLSDAVAIRVLK